MQLDSSYINHTVSESTLNLVTLRKKFKSFLESLQNEEIIKELEAIKVHDDSVSDIENITIDVEILVEILDKIAPEGSYFGSHIGDGALFGFWAVTEDE